MSEKKLVICDRELEYANKLAENILARQELHVNVHTFSDIKKAITYAEKHTVDIFVTDEMFHQEEREKLSAEIGFVLSHGGEINLLDGETAIYKYQGANEVIRDIFEKYVEKTDAKIFRRFRKDHTRIEAVYSPVRGIGKSRFAIAYGREKAKKEKVLYLNLEEYAGFEPAVPDENRMDLGDLIYFLKQSEGNLGLRLQSAVQKIGELDYVPPVYLPVDLKEIEKEEWIDFLEQLSGLNLYDLILLDLGESVQGLFDILEFCDGIHLPVRDDESSAQKLYRYERCLDRLKLEKIKNSTHQFYLPEDVEEFVRVRIKEEGKDANGYAV